MDSPVNFDGHSLIASEGGAALYARGHSFIVTLDGDERTRGAEGTVRSFYAGIIAAREVPGCKALPAAHIQDVVDLRVRASAGPLVCERTGTIVEMDIVNDIPGWLVLASGEGVVVDVRMLQLETARETADRAYAFLTRPNGSCPRVKADRGFGHEVGELLASTNSRIGGES